MMRSLYSGVAGLKTHQVKMDVIGNNIANVNTVAFKSFSTTFSDVMYQTTQSASGSNAATGTGGKNAKQIGLGVTAAATSISITSAGAAESTGNAFDIMLNDSNTPNFFIVNNGNTNVFTRDGSFYIDGNGNLCMSSTGYTVMGWQVDPATGDIRKDSVSALRVMQQANMTSAPEATTEATCAGILDKNDVDAASETGRAMNLIVYDSLGYNYTVKFAIREVDSDAGTYTTEVTDVLDTNGDSVLSTDAATRATQLASLWGAGNTGLNTLQFNADNGVFESINGANSATLNLSVLGGNLSNVNVDFSGTSNYGNGGTSTIACDKGSTTDSALGAGKKLGTLTGVSVDNAGKIYGTYNNGNTVLLGQIAVAQFSNASGLEAMGDSCFTETLNSGVFDGIGTEITADGGSMTTGALEMSNVDLSSEFTKMITTQRGFQANSRIITTSDSMLEELINLKR